MRVNRTVQLMPWNGWSIHILRYEVHSCSRTPHGVRGLKSDSIPEGIAHDASHPSRGAWIEILDSLVCRTRPASHPSRGAWIEIADRHRSRHHHKSHPSRGAWIEIPLACLSDSPSHRRTPHGVRGLKLAELLAAEPTAESHPSRGAWIEIRSASLTTR